MTFPEINKIASGRDDLYYYRSEKLGNSLTYEVSLTINGTLTIEYCIEPYHRRKLIFTGVRWVTMEHSNVVYIVNNVIYTRGLHVNSVTKCINMNITDKQIITISNGKIKITPRRDPANYQRLFPYMGTNFDNSLSFYNHHEHDNIPYNSVYKSGFVIDMENIYDAFPYIVDMIIAIVKTNGDVYDIHGELYVNIAHRVNTPPIYYLFRAQRAAIRTFLRCMRAARHLRVYFPRPIQRLIIDIIV